ncbi:recombinase family protein [Calycomorphotria hydatis]|uniref:Resolvase/invertase-type recombinase catalytic domain-containing protein n=1 Tax=Calycomorphotria hydatis TaxID=2528027 RepID=A0A517TDC8_9PLAN|nr:recombinase family protein [Calycomorphotria hydatis]QDT66373.1 hypothetical protein V22_36390 [Calycomorphotria hydatis]
MSIGNIPDRKRRGNPPSVLSLEEALARFSDAPIVVYVRVSERSQKSNGSLKKQRRTIVECLSGKGKVESVVEAVEYGKLSVYRPQFRKAIELAREVGAGVTALDTTRLLRAESFDKATNPFSEPTADEWLKLSRLADGVKFLATVMPPSTPLEELHSGKTRRGMKASSKKPGRRPAKKIQKRTWDKILEERAAGASMYSLQKKYKTRGIPRTTLRDFIKENENGICVSC